MNLKPVPAKALAPIPLTIPDDAPFVRWDDGSVRIKGSRVHFWLVARYLLAGKTCEAVAAAFPTVELDQVRWIADFVRSNRAEVDEHLRILSRHEDTIERHIKAEQARRTAFLERVNEAPRR